MRYWYDTEFIEDGCAIDLISIGIVAEDGRELYMQSFEFDPAKANGWIRENVLSHLKICHVSGKWNFDQSLYSWQRCEKPDCPWRTLSQIKLEILAFMDIEDYGKPELWGWCAAYDFVAFCQIFGTMMDLPEGYPHYIKDIQYVLDGRHIRDEELPQADGTPHNALADARHIQQVWKWLQTYKTFGLFLVGD
jgi:hypothetical protein